MRTTFAFPPSAARFFASATAAGAAACSPPPSGGIASLMRGSFQPSLATFFALAAAAGASTWVMNADGSGVTPLTAEAKRMFGPLAWSRDGHKLAAVSILTDFDEDKRIKYLTSDIFLVNTDGSGAKLFIHFSDPGIHVQSVSWSPDGRKIAFLWTRLLDGNVDPKLKGLNHNIWVMDADGSHVIPLTKFSGGSPGIREIGWSPDSRKVTYISNRALDGSDAGAAGTNIWVSNADGSGSLPLTRFRSMFVTVNAFSWSPDGSQLSFSSNGLMAVTQITPA